MDFIVSKVAMSICALVVVSVLGGVLGNSPLTRGINELESALIDLATAIERSISSRCEEITTWRVPFLSNGESMNVSIGCSVFRAWSGSSSAALKVACAVHTWDWNGTSLNSSTMETLDRESSAIVATSGRTLEIRTYVIMFEEREVPSAFVTPQH